MSISSSRWLTVTSDFAVNHKMTTESSIRGTTH